MVVLGKINFIFVCWTIEKKKKKCKTNKQSK